jgi:membrane protease YdiL (CAAX protease family)
VAGGARWYAVALLTAPPVTVAILVALSLTSPVSLPGVLTTSDKEPFLLLGIVSSLIVDLFEELGWTGFAPPRLLARRGCLATSLPLGLLWAPWHIGPDRPSAAACGRGACCCGCSPASCRTSCAWALTAAASSVR